jgi:hypothetical protein
MVNQTDIRWSNAFTGARPALEHRQAFIRSVCLSRTGAVSSWTVIDSLQVCGLLIAVAIELFLSCTDQSV